MSVSEPLKRPISAKDFVSFHESVPQSQQQELLDVFAFTKKYLTEEMEGDSSTRMEHVLHGSTTAYRHPHIPLGLYFDNSAAVRASINMYRIGDIGSTDGDRSVRVKFSENGLAQLYTFVEEQSGVKLPHLPFTQMSAIANANSDPVKKVSTRSRIPFSSLDSRMEDIRELTLKANLQSLCFMIGKSHVDSNGIALPIISSLMYRPKEELSIWRCDWLSEGKFEFPLFDGSASFYMLTPLAGKRTFAYITETGYFITRESLKTGDEAVWFDK